MTHKKVGPYSMENPNKLRSLEPSVNPAISVTGCCLCPDFLVKAPVTRWLHTKVNSR